MQRFLLTRDRRFNPKLVSTDSIADIISTVFSNGYQDGKPVPNGVGKPTSKGIAATYGDEYAFYAIMLAIGSQSEAAANTKVEGDNPTALADSVSWTWQTCTEVGYFQVANTSSPNNLLSSFINVTSWQDEQCDANFNFSELPQEPNAKTLVDKYGGWNMNPNQVMFTDGLK